MAKHKLRDSLLVALLAGAAGHTHATRDAPGSTPVASSSARKAASSRSS
jgi:hypothetical protein